MFAIFKRWLNVCSLKLFAGHDCMYFVVTVRLWLSCWSCCRDESNWKTRKCGNGKGDGEITK